MHSKDLSLLISSNPIENLWKKEISQDEISSEIKQKVSKPFRWEPSIHQAAYKGKKSSIEYSLSLLPQILNLTDDKNNTPVHYAAIGNQKKCLYTYEILVLILNYQIQMDFCQFILFLRNLLHLQ